MSTLIESGISQREACRSISTSRATWNRWRKAATSPAVPFRLVRSGIQPHALSAAERADILAVCNSERFCNSAPRAIVATLLDEGCFLASVSTIYRILRAEGQVHERRAIAVHPAHLKPELVATAPNELWTWDVSVLQQHRRSYAMS
jgi:putative transposase